MPVSNPGSQPVEGAREELAAANLPVFLAAVREHGGNDITDPVRRPDLDADGRYAWSFTVDGMDIDLLMPGVDLARVRDDLTATAPCLRINGQWAWWNGAVYDAVPLKR